jgi:hypothetical protein
MKNVVELALGGTTGGQVISGTVAVTGEFDCFVVNEDAVITELDVNDIDVTAARGLTGVTLSAGTFIGAGYAYTQSGFNLKNKITSITLASGSLIAY